MSRLLLTAAVLAVLVYTMVLGVRWLSPRIEQDIAERVTTGLAEQGLLFADVGVEGRDVVLSGNAPDGEARDRALNVASRVFGVSKVQDNLTVAGEASATDVVAAAEPKPAKKGAKKAPVEDYALTITKDGEKVVLEGAVPDEASKKILVELATNRYTAENVDASKLTVEEGAPAGWRSAVGAVLMHISNMEQAKVIISNTEVMVSGNVLDQEFSDKMEQDVTQVLPKEYKAAFAVEVVTPTVADVAPAAGEAVAVTETAAVTETKPATDSKIAEAKVTETKPVEKVAAPVKVTETKAVTETKPKAEPKVEAKPVVAATPTQAVTPTKVASAAGCSQIELSEQTLMFGFDRAELNAGHKAKIATVANHMKGCADEKMVMAGYTDVTGSKLYNKWLSQQRAEATMRGMMREGVAKDRLKAVGYGDMYPVAPNTTKAERAKNRRVEFYAGDALPHAVVDSKADAKEADIQKVVAPKAKKVKAEKAADVSDAKVSTAEVSATTVSPSIAKPWWARKTVSDTAVEVK